jgi:hypothetical protein
MITARTPCKPGDVDYDESRLPVASALEKHTVYLPRSGIGEFTLEGPDADLRSKHKDLLVLLLHFQADEPLLCLVLLAGQPQQLVAHLILVPPAAIA